MLLNKRKTGVLLHITSLPSEYGIGTLGKEAYHFIDWMKLAGLKIWQTLPLVPTNYGDSPYQSVSSTALNYYLIDFDILRKKKLLLIDEYKDVVFYERKDKVNYSLLFDKKIDILRLAFNRFDCNDKLFISFVEKGEFKDFAVFMTIKAMHQYQAWELWEEKYQKYSKELEEEVISSYKDDYLFWVWTQYEFLNEWNNLHSYAKNKGIEIMGDMPLYVAYDSVEVWKYPELFELTSDHKKKLVAGCPPDKFSDDGQLWGNPIYNWKYLKETNYAWWNERISRAFELYDILRIDHFRGFDRFYAIPAVDDTARGGWWVDGPKFDFFKDKLDLKIVAEDLGVVDEGLLKLMNEVGYPGMKVLGFAFEGDPNYDHKPSLNPVNSIVYTGTHDNMTMLQHITSISEEELNVFVSDVLVECKKMGVEFRNRKPKDLVETVVELAFASKANLCIIPMQDFLLQGGESRMNFPSTVSVDNWSYRILKKHLNLDLNIKIRNLVKKYNRM